MILAVDTETTGLDTFHGCRPFLVTACDGDSNYYWQGMVNPYTREVFWQDEVLENMQHRLDRADTLVFHNAQFDMRMLNSIGIKINHLWDRTECTMLASHAICSGDTHALKELAIKYLHYWDDDEDELAAAVKAARPRAAAAGYRIAKYKDPCFPGAPKNSEFWKQDYWLCPDECLKYGLGDVERTWLLWDAFKVALINDGLIGPYKQRRKLLRICYEITEAGLDFKAWEAREHVRTLDRKLTKLRKMIEKELKVTFKFNWAKPSHLQLLIHKHLQIPVYKYTETGKPSTDKDTIKHYIDNNNHRLLRILRAAKVYEAERNYVKSYLDWDCDGKIHSTLRIEGTRETRQSSADPNQQNIKRTLWHLFGPEPGYIWLEMDFVNIELMIWAYSVGNKELIEAFEQGKSVHQMVMQTIYPREYEKYLQDKSNEFYRKFYQFTKNGNFAVIYGATEKKADETYKRPGAYKTVIQRFPGIQEFTDSRIQQVEQNRLLWKSPSVITIGGYRLDVPLEEPYKACNFYVQGSAGIFTGRAMVAIDANAEYRASGSRMIAQIHDSLKIRIPIHPRIKRTVYSLVDTMETASESIFGRTKVDWEIKVNDADRNNELLKGLI